MKQPWPSDRTMIFILREDEIYGPFGMDLIDAMLVEGRITLSDLAREEGGKWKPLEVFLREPALLHSSSMVRVTPTLDATQEEKPYLNSPAPGQRNIAPYLAASFPSGYKPFKERAKESLGCLILGLLLLLLPFIGWILGPLVMLGAFAQLFDSRPDPKSFKDNWNRMIGDFHRDGYQDGFFLFLGFTAILVGISAILLVFLSEQSESFAPGAFMFSGPCFMVGVWWIRNYFVPKHLR